MDNNDIKIGMYHKKKIYIWWQEDGCSQASVKTIIRNELLEAQMYLMLQTFRRLELRQWMKIMSTRLAYVKNLVQ